MVEYIKHENMGAPISKRKIAILTGLYPHFNGGAEYQMRVIADQLKEQYEIVFVYLGDVTTRVVKETYSKYIDGYKVYFIKSPSRLDALSLRIFYARRLYQLLKNEKPDFVYQRVLKFVSFYISEFQKKLKYTHIIHIADLYTLQFKQATLRGKLAYYFFRKTVNNRPRFVVQTNEQGALLESYGVQSFVQIYNMHPLPIFSAEKEIEKKKSNPIKTIVWIGNLRPIKQLEVFLDIADAYKSNASLQFVVIGNPFDSRYAESMLKRMKALANVVHYAGKDNVFVNDVILKKAYLTVNTSESEGFSNVFIQSWLRGVPVLSLNSNPDDIFTKHACLGAYCNNNAAVMEKMIMEAVLANDYQEDARKCADLAKRYFSFENIEKIRSLLEGKI